MDLSTNVLSVIGLSVLVAITTTGLLFYLKTAEIAVIRVVLGIMVALLVFGGAGLLLSKVVSLPTVFWSLSLLAFLVGTAFSIWGNRLFPWCIADDFRSGFLTILAWASWSLVGFGLVYGIMSEKSAFYLPSLTVGVLLPMLLPYIFKKSYDFLASIPTVRYRRWYFDPNNPLPVLEPINLVRVNMQFTKNIDETEPNFEGYEVEFPSDLALGALFQYFIYSHNNRHRDYKKNPIPYQHDGAPIGWVLYKQPTTNQKIYLNTDQSLVQNNIQNHDTIFAHGLTN